MKIIQISDLHLSKNSEDRLFDLVNTEATFLAVLQLVKSHRPDLVVASGDLSQDGSIESYIRLNQYLNQLDCDTYTIYGNHDNKANFDKYLLGGKVKQVKHLITPDATFIFLNSLKIGYESGYIEADEICFLEECCKRYTNCIIVIHHHFVELGTAIDFCMLENKQELINILTKYKHNIKFCMTGHVHNFYTTMLGNIPIYSSVSTCIQFAETKELLFDNKPPGFLVYEINSTTHSVTDIYPKITSHHN